MWPEALADWRGVTLGPALRAPPLHVKHQDVGSIQRSSLSYQGTAAQFQLQFVQISSYPNELESLHQCLAPCSIILLHAVRVQVEAADGNYYADAPSWESITKLERESRFWSLE